MLKYFLLIVLKKIYKAKYSVTVYSFKSYIVLDSNSYQNASSYFDLEMQIFSMKNYILSPLAVILFHLFAYYYALRFLTNLSFWKNKNMHLVSNTVKEFQNEMYETRKCIRDEQFSTIFHPPLIGSPLVYLEQQINLNCKIILFNF